jgi:protein-disulfide isomerase
LSSDRNNDDNREHDFRVSKEGDNDSSNRPMSNNNNATTISINRSTFTKIVAVGIAALMVASFFGGYTWRATFYPGSTTVVPSIGTLGQQQPTLAGAPSQMQQQPQLTKIASVNTDGAPVKGKANAPVTMVEFADFQCPFCSRFASDTFQQLVKSYVDTGQVKFVYKQYPLPFHPNAQPAAMASECATEQGKFWPMHDKLYATQTTWASQDAATVKKTFKEYAVSLGLNAASFNSCFDSNKYSDKIQKQSSEGSQYGVSGTPTFYIGNQKAGYTPIVGAQPLASFENVIKQLSSSGNGVKA